MIIHIFRWTIKAIFHRHTFIFAPFRRWGGPARVYNFLYTEYSLGPFHVEVWDKNNDRESAK